MNEQERGLELKVGIFVFVGLAVLAALVVQFGRVGEGFKTYYNLTIRFSDASGLLKGSDVLMGGAKIGRVSGGPRLLLVGQGVAVPLRIYDYVKIPAASKFTVGSSGLLGDRFVSVTPPAGQPATYVAKNAVVEGVRETGLDDLTREGSFLVKDLRGTVQNINTTVSRLNNQAFSEASMQNLKSSIEHLNQTTGSLAESSKKIDGVIAKADATLGSTKKAADDLQLAVADARKTIKTAGQVMSAATTGNGLLATLLTNEEVGNNLRALISNLRSHGILFYRDSAAKTEATRQRETPGRSEGH
jgi:phospholipid/cholesterol/gamma-HCH transport system substrate-binding protein